MEMVRVTLFTVTDKGCYPNTKRVQLCPLPSWVYGHRDECSHANLTTNLRLLWARYQDTEYIVEEPDPISYSAEVTLIQKGLDPSDWREIAATPEGRQFQLDADPTLCIEIPTPEVVYLRSFYSVECTATTGTLPRDASSMADKARLIVTEADFKFFLSTLRQPVDPELYALRFAWTSRSFCYVRLVEI